MRYHASRGFTLIELMVVVAIVAILAAIAYPSYLDSVRKSRRSEAISTLENIRIDQAKWRANNPSYAPQASLTIPTTTYYNIAVPTNNSASFTATASAKSGTSQANDVSTCQTFTINQNGPVGTSDHIKTCWSR